MTEKEMIIYLNNLCNFNNLNGNQLEQIVLGI